MVTRIEVPREPTVRAIFSQYFHPGRTPNCYLLPNGYEFRVEVVGDDAVCDFAGLGWISIRGYEPQFINVEHLLRHYRLISGELLLRYGKIQDTHPQENKGKGTKSDIHEAFALFFTPVPSLSRKGTMYYQELPGRSKTRFHYELEGDDVVCNLNSLSWKDLAVHGHLFVSLGEYLVKEGLLKGKVIMNLGEVHFQRSLLP